MIGFGSLRNRLRVEGLIRFESAFHLGTGEEGTMGVDMGVLLDPAGRPLVPGASLKGVFRSHAEALAEHLGFFTCYLSPSVMKRGDRTCIAKDKEEERRALRELDEYHDPEKIAEFLEKNLCDTCILFGSVLAQSKVFFRDASVSWWPEVLERRDGVAIDRDSGQAVSGQKFDFEVVPAGSTFDFQLEAENLSDREQGLIFAVLAEWSRGFHLGGMTSRGLGAARLENLTVRLVDFGQRQEAMEYLLHGTMRELSEDERFQKIEALYERQG